MKTPILETGCSQCKTLTANGEKAVQEIALPVVIEKMTNIKEILMIRDSDAPRFGD